jgi:hypothetical protein
MVISIDLRVVVTVLLKAGYTRKQIDRIVKVLIQSGEQYKQDEASKEDKFLH